MSHTVAFLGAGSMAEAMISGIVKSGTLEPSQVIVSNKTNHNRLQELKVKYGVRAINREALPYNEIDVFVLAMKPKDIDYVLDDLSSYLQPHHLLVSVLAGISTSYMEERLPQQQVIRVMPNTSSMIRESSTALSPGTFTTDTNLHFAEALMKGIGKTYVIEEAQMDVFTGMAGSGPAYIYNLMEHLEEVGVEGGLDREIARDIAAQTIMGAGKMMLLQDDTPTELRQKVTSPNGTTAAGLDALDEHGGGQAMAEAVKGAAKRSREMSRDLERPVVT
ncbi:pyrroline-5-carboxylate reductase [Pontibacillus halophilus JSM 076056 = DSM 19796]|uniref:Pyrroline-5-carboxylate reductase n=1 Tax=Pontibacillus halophilus JSM 076056 = DSM 19796 TaxID=1385510 RepID=A0A0A5GGL6_9BACI|nr:pyrroline-5-carboxylate reductase [Pontibacillus halophilus]KGX91129.1 pyrroline-5-carboxylate reductase [Pontibacillus halophilus JSM 076056 = DSM 19796]